MRKAVVTSHSATKEKAKGKKTSWAKTVTFLWLLLIMTPKKKRTKTRPTVKTTQQQTRTSHPDIISRAFVRNSFPKRWCSVNSIKPSFFQKRLRQYSDPHKAKHGDMTGPTAPRSQKDDFACPRLFSLFSLSTPLLDFYSNEKETLPMGCFYIYNQERLRKIENVVA
ncbi:hypothetical protein IWX47DRAFT_158474 [Phyllosticta citricarpa]|uniref:Uncharacterized protein n=1 Tax=Phyllosticta citricarpa TaxID=55181 RepID=A0ABR1MEM8_9PEZI